MGQLHFRFCWRRRDSNSLRQKQQDEDELQQGLGEQHALRNVRPADAFGKLKSSAHYDWHKSPKLNKFRQVPVQFASN